MLQVRVGEGPCHPQGDQVGVAHRVLGVEDRDRIAPRCSEDGVVRERHAPPRIPSRVAELVGGGAGDEALLRAHAVASGTGLSR